MIKNALSKRLVFLLNIFVVLFIGYVDYLLGYELGFSLFYLIAVILSAWYINLTSAIFISILCGATWLAADWVTGHVYSHPLIAFWNAGIRLGIFLVVSYLIDLLKHKIQRIQDLSNLDFLTGLTSMRFFTERLNDEIERTRRYQTPFSLVFIDLDNFKSINDELGHKAGDYVLQKIAQAIQDNIRQTDTAARFGGDEFLLLLPETQTDEAAIVVEKIQAQLALIAKENNWPIGASAGVLLCPPTDKSSYELIDMADKIMYSAKRTGKNKIKLDLLS